MNNQVDYVRLLAESGENVEVFNEKLSDFFPAIILVYDLDDKRFRYANRRFTDLLGFTLEDIQDPADSLAVLATGDDVARIRNGIEQLQASEGDQPVNFSCRLKQKTGNCLHFAITGGVLRRNSLGRPVSVLFIAQDITRQLKEDEGVEALQELFAEIENFLQFGSWSWDAVTKKTEWTNGLYDIFEYERTKIGKLNLKFYLRHVAEDALGDFLKVLNEAKSNKTDFECEYGIRTKNGKHKIVHTKSKAILDDQGNLKRIIGITRDITDIKNFEKERDKSIRELNRSNKELEEFAYIASHDLQEPLRKISTFGERLKQKLESSMGDECSLYMERILASTENMRILIDNLLEFSKVSSSQHLYAPCDLNVTLKAVISDQEIRMEEASIVLNVDTLPTVDGASTELKQLFNNLLSNAIKFRRSDVQLKVAIRSERLNRSGKVKYHLPVDRNYYKIEVIDNGIGFEKEYAEQIFQIFQRLHGKAEYPGSGIGLAICKKIVDNHEGLIFAKGTPNRGSIFTVILPQKQSI